MPPRKVKVVSMGTPAEEPTKSTMVILNDVEEVVEDKPREPPSTPLPPPPPEQPDAVAEPEEEKPFIDNEEIDNMLKEVRENRDALIMAGIVVQKHRDEQAANKEECIHCGKTMSKKSLKYSHSKTCKGLQPGDIQAITTPDPEESPVVEPEPVPEPIKPKKPRAKSALKATKPEVKVEEPVACRAKTAAELLVEQREQRRQLRQVRISMLASQAF